MDAEAATSPDAAGDDLVQEQRSTLAQHERVVASLPLAVLTTDDEGVVEAANPAAATLLDASPALIEGAPLASYVEPEDRLVLRAALQGLVPDPGHVHHHVRLVTRSGVGVPVDAYAVRDHRRAQPSVTWVLTPARHVQDDDDLSPALVGLTRLAAVVDGPEDFLPRAAQLCQGGLGDAVSISLVLGDPTQPDVIAVTSPLAQGVDGAQVTADEGPCATSYEVREVVVSRDLRDDERWPRLRHFLGPLDVGGAVAAPLLLDEGVVGALNVFCVEGVEPSARMVRRAELLALAVGAVLHELRVRGDVVRTAAGLREALASRAIIDQAKGIVMADRRCSADQAFQHLVDLSSRHHVKLRDLAADLVARTGGAR